MTNSSSSTSSSMDELQVVSFDADIKMLHILQDLLAKAGLPIEYIGGLNSRVDLHFHCPLTAAQRAQAMEIVGGFDDRACQLHADAAHSLVVSSVPIDIRNPHWTSACQWAFDGTIRGAIAAVTVRASASKEGSCGLRVVDVQNNAVVAADDSCMLDGLAPMDVVLPTTGPLPLLPTTLELQAKCSPTGVPIRLLSVSTCIPS